MNYINTKNTTELMKGSKILNLEECTAENSLKTYKTNSYLTSIYKLYSTNGFEPYASIEDFIKDFENNNNHYFIKTFMTVFDELKECSKYPFYNGTDKYMYTCLREQDIIEQIIEDTFYKVFKTIDTGKLHDLTSLKVYIKTSIKQKAHLNRCIKKIKIVVPYDTETLEYLAKTHNIEDQYIKNETKKLIRTTLKNYINTKDEIDTLIIVKNLMRHGIPYGEKEGYRLTLNYIAELCNLSERAVKARKKKLTSELEVLCQNEIIPLMIS